MAGHKKPAIPTLFFATILSFALLPLQQRFFLAANPQPSVDTNQRVDCLPSRYPLEKKEGDCTKVGCIWDGYFDQYNPTVPQCFFPPNQGYQVVSTAEGKIHLKWPLDIALKNAYSPANLDIQFESREMGAALALKIGNEKRFTPPVPLNREAKIESTEKLAFKYSSKGAFAFTVERESDGLKIWDTSIGGFVFGDKFIQIATFLPTDRIYGFGENLHHQLKHDFGAYKTWGMFSRDQVEDAYIPGSVNEYGVHPFYLGLESSGKAHGVLIFNSNAQEYTTGPGPHLIYRTIGGQMELFFFPGPTPEEVIRQYQQLVGRPYLPAYWAFGFQICRYGYKSLEDLKAVVKRTRQAEIPFDVQYADIDYMERYKDFTYDTEKWAEFPKYIDELHSMGMKLILIFDPPVQVNYSSFQRGLEMGATFVEWPSYGLVQKEINDLYEETKGTKIMLGAMWPDYHSAFPDWLDPENKTTKWWIQEFVRFHKEIPFDGLWIDMNEPSVFGTNEAEPWYWKKDSFIPDKPHILPLKCPKNSELDFPPYKTWNVYQHEKEGDPEISLCQNTLCMIGRMGRDSFDMYDTHSLYGWSEMVATQQALREATGGKRGAVISRSTFPSSGQHGGHWLGDNKSRWPDLRISIIGIQEFNMFGIPHVGSDVCGFGMDTNEELCLRWQQLGAFYSYYRNHNDINHPDQDPAQWPSVAKATKEANLFRYRHLPHLYSLHFRASLLGGTVVRSLFFEFPLDPNTHSMSFQFMWGPGILVLPVISPNVDSVHGYLPPGEFWYSMSMANEYGAKMPTGYSTFNAPRDTPLPTFIRGGHIIPRQVPSITTTATRKNPFQLLIAFNSAGIADGELYWDDGDTAFDKIEEHSFCHFQFHAESNSKGTFIRIERKHSSLNEKLPNLEQIEIFGHLANVEKESIEMNGKRVDLEKEKCKFESNLVVIEAKGMVDLNGQGPWELKWKNNENKPGNGIFGGKMINSLLIFGAFCVSIAAAIFH